MPQQRLIKRIIWHCSATKEGQDVKTSTIRGWHVNERGWRDIGYHFVIELDGSVHTGRPLRMPGAGVKGHNVNSAHLCYVGGVEADGKTPKDTRTPAQRSALYKLTGELIERFPGATVHGHNEYSNKACPSFDAQRDWEARNLSPDITPGLSPEDMRDEDFDPDVDPGVLEL